MIIAANRVGKNLDDRWVLSDVSFVIERGERIGLVGPNGSGKTTLLRLLAGVMEPDRGEVFLAKGARIGYLEQIPQADPGATVQDVLHSPFAELIKLEREMERLANRMADPRLDEKRMERVLNRYQACQEEFEKRGGYEMEARIRRVVRGLNLPEDVPDRPFAALSGGEKTKVGLAQVLLSEPDLLLLDEPTNHLDLAALEWLEDFLSQWRGAVVVVSHDRYFLDRVANWILDLEDGRCTLY